MTRLDQFVTQISGPIEQALYDGSADESELRAKQLDVIAKTAFNNLRAYSNCCRSTLWALQTHLELPAPALLAASTTLAGGIVSTGETCGAVLGALIAIGYALGSASIQDTASHQAARAAAEEFVAQFTNRFGSTRCYEVQKATVGWCSDNPSNRERWIAAEGPAACAAVCGDAARIAAEILLVAVDGA